MFRRAQSNAGGFSVSPDDHWVLLQVDFEFLTREGTVSPAQPNPFTSKTSFQLGIPRASNVVYDVAGRRVYRSAAAMRGGWQEVGFAGIDNDGRALPSGVYLYQVTAAGETAWGKVAIQRR